MAFKMRSGNTPKFKMVGSSPFKQADIAPLEGNVGLTARNEEDRALRAQALLDEENAESQKQANQPPSEGEVRDARKKEIKHLKENAPWTDKAKDQNKEQHGTGEMEEYDTGEVDDEGNAIMGEREIMQDLEEGQGFGTKTDLNTNKYKSKVEIKHDKKLRGLKSKAQLDDPDTDEDESKYSRREKYGDKQEGLLDDYQRSRGTGGNALSFNVLNAITGGSVGSGFSVVAKKDKIAKQMEKNQAKIKKQEAKDASKKLLNKQKDENRTQELNARIAKAGDNEKKVKRLTKKLPANKAAKKRADLDKKITKSEGKGRTKRTTRLKHQRHTKGWSKNTDAAE